MDLNPTTLNEIAETIKKRKNNKAAGVDGIPSDAMKGSLKSSAQALHGLFSRILEAEENPQGWKEGHIVIQYVPKRGYQFREPRANEPFNGFS